MMLVRVQLFFQFLLVVDCSGEHFGGWGLEGKLRWRVSSGQNTL